MAKHKTDDFVAIVASVVDFKQKPAQFFLSCSTVWSSLQHIHVPITADVANFVPTTTELQTDHFTPCACTWGNNHSPQVSGSPLWLP